MSSAKLAGRLCSLVDRLLDRMEKSVTALEQSEPHPSGIGMLGLQVTQMSQAISYMRKEERETAKNPLEQDKLEERSEEDIMQEMLSILSEEDLEMMLEIKKKEKLDDKGSQEMDSQGRE